MPTNATHWKFLSMLTTNWEIDTYAVAGCDTLLHLSSFSSHLLLFLSSGRVILWIYLFRYSYHRSVGWLEMKSTEALWRFRSQRISLHPIASGETNRGKIFNRHVRLSDLNHVAIRLSPTIPKRLVVALGSDTSMKQVWKPYLGKQR